MSTTKKKCKLVMSTQTDMKLKEYINKRVPTNNKLYVDELTHEALVGYALEIQALFNKRVAANTQTTTDLLDVCELNSKMVVGLNTYFGPGVMRDVPGSGQVDIITGDIIIPGQGASNSSNKNNNRSNNNNNNNNNNKDLDLENKLEDGIDGKKSGGTLDATTLALIKAFTKVIKGAPEDATLDKDGRKKKRRKLGRRDEKSVRYICVANLFLSFFLFLYLSFDFHLY